MNYPLIILASVALRFLVIHTAKAVTPARRGSFAYRNAQKGKLSPQLNIAETLWRMLKGECIRPQDYESAGSLFYAANSALAAVGTSLFIKHSHFAL